MSGSLDANSSGASDLQVLWRDDEKILCRRSGGVAGADTATVLAIIPLSERPSSSVLDRLAHEYHLREDLDASWAVRPLELFIEAGRTALMMEDPGGEPLQGLLRSPMNLSSFLRLAIDVTAVLGKVHQRGLVHKDIKPLHIFVGCRDDRVRLTGFGIASRLQRERYTPAPPEFIAGTLAYMAPEQTGRMNRSVDHRSDLYSLGVTFYQMLTGQLPFVATDPTEWVHCHIARRPIPPSELLPSIPKSVAAIVMKLLAKTAEDRYQTAGGAERDLRRCLDDWDRRQVIDDFPLGQYDVPDRLMMPEKLYGREPEINALLAAFDRIARGEAPILALVSGKSGIGKSAVVNEFYRTLVPRRGLLSGGKFDQYMHDIPYSTFKQALQAPIRALLGKSEAELNEWRSALQEALEPNGRLVVDLVPELGLILGDQPPVVELPPTDSQRRFQLVLGRFLAVFARPEHPFVLFLDDLQWLDIATLELIEYLLVQSDLRFLMLIGAYRDDEVDSEHPLTSKIGAIRRAGGLVEEIRLGPLGNEQVAELVTDALRCQPSCAAPLAEIVHKKTSGNPFFVTQFLQTLADERVLSFDLGALRWNWDLRSLHANTYADSVVKLVVGKLLHLPAKTQRALQLFACLGASAHTEMLSIVLGSPKEQVHLVLAAAVRQELVERRGMQYHFTHDRVREAAYSLIAEPSRAANHLQIGRLLKAKTPPERLEEAVFEIVSQLNLGMSAAGSSDERDEMAQLNLIAGNRAKASTAYVSASTYFKAGQEQLGDDRWVRQRQLSFQLDLQRAECEFLVGEFDAAEERLTELSRQASDTVERANVACIRIDLYTTLNRSDRAVAVGLEYLSHLGVMWSAHPTEQEARDEYARIWSHLGDDLEIKDLLDLRLMTDPGSLATLDVISKILPPALFTDANLFSVASCRAVNLSIENGNCDASCVAYVWLGMIAGPRFENYSAGFEFARVGYDLVEKRGLKRFTARTYLWFAQFVMPWNRHIILCRDLMRQAFDAANKVGDMTIAGYACNNLNTNMLAAGDSLALTQSEAEKGFEFAQKARFGFVSDIIAAQLGLIRTLRGLTQKFGCFDNDTFNESEFERHLAADGTLALPECWYWTRKLQARFFAGDYDVAVDATLRADRLIWTTPAIFEKAECYFYGALAIAARCDIAAGPQGCQYFEMLQKYSRQLEIWSQNCGENFDGRAALVRAEIARIEGRELDAERSYEQAISSSRTNGFVHIEAVANERAALFYAVRGFRRISDVLLYDARYCYLRWGADGKVQQLDEDHPRLATNIYESGSTSTIGEPIERLDLATVIQVSQAVAGEIVLDRLIDTLLRNALTHAGAERALLIVLGEVGHQIAAEATISDSGLIVRAREAVDSAHPESVVQYVVRTADTVVIDDAMIQPEFAMDPYVRQRQVRSVLCLPLTTQARLVAVLYLENNLAPRVFVPARSAILKLLASQAAIAYENARLYKDLAVREAKIRRLVDTSIVGIAITLRTGEIVEANDAFLKIVGYDRADLSEHRIRWTELMASGWQSSTDQVRRELLAPAVIQPYEQECLRKDGTRVPVLIGSATFDERQADGVVFVLDLSKLKQAEAGARKMERELAHANRVATMGLLTASIAHEIQQPIAATVTNANAGLRFLNASPVDLEEIQLILGDIVKDGSRAGEIISRTRALIGKVPPRRDALEVNETIREVLELTRGETTKNNVLVLTEFGERLPAIR